MREELMAYLRMMMSFIKMSGLAAAVAVAVV
jgi:hypothetical protein